MKNEHYTKGKYHNDVESKLTDAYVTYDLDGDLPYNIHLDFDERFALKLEGEALIYFYNKITDEI
jgi:hypothetical protein|tara:strand:+ start:367 stop:561 length:195 start_codon:yes stop_codon:yes gene_type:complete